MVRPTSANSSHLKVIPNIWGVKRSTSYHFEHLLLQVVQEFWQLHAKNPVKKIKDDRGKTSYGNLKSFSNMATHSSSKLESTYFYCMMKLVEVTERATELEYYHLDRKWNWSQRTCQMLHQRASLGGGIQILKAVEKNKLIKWSGRC